jgi:hypothetical protein
MTSPVLFGEKTAWCAFQTTDVERVGEVLFKDRKPRPVSWEEGVDAAYDWPAFGFAKVLVTPPIDGYVLAMTQGWLGWWKGGDIIARDLGRDADNVGEIATRASEWGGDLCCDAQFYASHRVYGLYGWGRARFTDLDEDRERVFIKYTGEFTESHGVITPEERVLAASVHDSWAALGFVSAQQLASRLDEERAELLRQLESGQFELVGAGRDDLDTIVALHLAIDPGQVAARWSVDPNTLDERSDLLATCWLGELYV